MDSKIIALFLFLSIILLTSLFGNLPPVVSNVTPAQRIACSKIVDTYYDVIDADNDNLTVTLQVSNNNSVTYTVPPGIPSNVILSYGNGQIHLNWDRVINANSYIIYAYDNPIGPFNMDISNQSILTLSNNRYTRSMPFNQLFRQYYVVKSSTRATMMFEMNDGI